MQKSSLIYSIKPQYVELIVERKKNHEFRNRLPRKIPNIIWIYTTVPRKEIRYFMEVDKPVIYPNKINVNGIGNIEFNSGWKYAKNAYPICHLFELKSPLDLDLLKSQYNFTAPQSFVYLEKNLKLKNKLYSAKYKQIF